MKSLEPTLHNILKVFHTWHDNDDDTYKSSDDDDIYESSDNDAYESNIKASNIW